jgi:Icc-related predicted phosphoesterase
VHGKGISHKGVGFYGYGGARTPFNTLFEPADGEIELGLVKGYEEIKSEGLKVQVTHMPPARTEVDRIFSGAHVGSEAIRKFNEERQPNVAVSAHIHEGKGVDEIGKTKLVNPGRFPEGNCALVSVNPVDSDARIISLSEEIAAAA